MEPIFYSTMASQLYTPLWSKYRPVILQLMRAAEDAPQQYKFFDHEFKSMNPKEKRGFAFTLQVVGGKAVNNIKSAEIAQDLLYILLNSRKGAELMDGSGYEFSLDKQFVLHVNRLEEPAEAGNE